VRLGGVCWRHIIDGDVEDSRVQALSERNLEMCSAITTSKLGKKAIDVVDRSTAWIVEG
jgi:hypothetical protein